MRLPIAIAGMIAVAMPAVTRAQVDDSTLRWVAIDTTRSPAKQTMRWAAVERRSGESEALLLRTERRMLREGEVDAGMTTISRLRCVSNAEHAEPVAVGRGIGAAAELLPTPVEYGEARLAILREEFGASAPLQRRYGSVDGMLRALARQDCTAAADALRRAGHLTAAGAAHDLVRAPDVPR